MKTISINKSLKLFSVSLIALLVISCGKEEQKADSNVQAAEQLTFEWKMVTTL